MTMTALLAAVRCNGHVYTGFHHADAMEAGHIEALTEHEEGFIWHGRFLSRENAARLAVLLHIVQLAKDVVALNSKDIRTGGR